MSTKYEKSLAENCDSSTPTSRFTPQSASTGIHMQSAHPASKNSTGPTVPLCTPLPKTDGRDPQSEISLQNKDVSFSFPVPDHDRDSPSLRDGVFGNDSPGANTADSPNNDKASPPGDWKYPWLYDNAERYMECLAEFQRFSDEWVGVRGWIEEHLAKMVDIQHQDHDDKEVMQPGAECAYLPQLKRDEKVYRMLGVGSGSGEVDAAILRVLQPRHPNISAAAIEPDASQISMYRRLMAASNFSGVEFTFHQQTSSEFIEKNIHSNATFDLIHMVHVLYHIEMAELEATILQYFKRLSPRGLMLIAYESDKSSLARIRRVLQPFKPGMRPYMSIADIERVLSEVAPSYQRHNIKGTLDVTACLQENPALSGERIWDFITRVVNFRANAPGEVVQRAADMLRRFSNPGEGGKIVTNTDTAVIIVKGVCPFDRPSYP